MGNSEQPIFIFGCARSGTSLLSRIIDSHPAIGVPFESHLYNTFYPWLKYYGDLSLGKNRTRLVDDIFSTGAFQDWVPFPNRELTLSNISEYSFKGIVNAIIGTWANEQGKNRWGEKTPWHAYFWKQILADFPDAKYIHIVRDGRDSSTSWKNARFGPKHYYQLAKRWVDFLDVIDAFKSNLSNPDYSLLELRYEDILDDPESATKKICDFVGEKHSPLMLEFYKKKRPYGTDDQNDRNLSKPLMGQNVNKWEKSMTTSDLRIFEAIAGNKLEKYGYQQAIENPNISQREEIFIKYFIHPYRRIFSIAKNTKGHVDLIKRLTIYFKIRCGL